MDSGRLLVKENPRSEANVFSKAVFGWMIPFFYKGVKKGIEFADLCKVLTSDKSDVIGDALEREWDAEMKRANALNEPPKLFKAIKAVFFLQFMIYGCILFIQQMVFRTFQPVVLGYLIRRFQKENEDEEDLQLKMYLSGTCLILVSVVIVFMTHHCNFGLNSIGMRVRVAVSSLVYRKLLRLSKASLGQTAAGQIVNLLSNDVSRFDFVTYLLHYLWIAPFQVGLVTYLLWRQVEVACLAGILAMIVFTLPLQMSLGKFQAGLRAKIAVRTDKRVKLMNEIIAGIQVIKMYAWEKPFENVVKFARSYEIEVLTKAAYIRGIFLSCMVFVDKTTLYLTIITYVLTDHNITSDKVFSMQQFYSILQMALAIYIPMAISTGAECIVSIRRLGEFLCMEERGESAIQKSNDQKIKIKDVSAIWTQTNEHLTLDKIDIELPAGKLCAVVGPVGAGKSSILQMLLGELPLKEGKVSVCGEIAYSSQEPWLFQATVRNNIVFGESYEVDRYNSVTRVCALRPDFKQFPHGDQTIVGERGVSLSGGQRARINLARAVYREADIYLMDDPLSAVDTHVGKHLFEECIVKYLKGKTRILVTHQLQYLKKADLIVVLNDGKIEAQGTFDELAAKSDLAFTKLLVAADETTEENKPEQKEGRKSFTRSVSTVSAKTDEEQTPDKTQENNEEEIGLLGKSATKEYLKACGSWCLVGTILFLVVMTQVWASCADLWVTYWTNQEEIRHEDDDKDDKSTFTSVDNFFNMLSRGTSSIYSQVFNTDNNSKYYYTTEEFSPRSDGNITTASRSFDWDLIFGEPIDTNWAIYIYTAIIVLVITFTLIRSFSFFKTSMVAGANLHADMFNCLLKSPMRFFDINPSGRVLNRFSKDMGAVDETLPRVLMEAIQIMLNMIGALILIVISNYIMIAAIVVFGILFYFMRKWYLSTVRTVKHLEGIMKSPVFSHLNSSLNGITTIRASHAETDLIKQFDLHQDGHTSAWFYTIACVSSFGLWTDFICIIFTAMVTYSFIIMYDLTDIDGSTVGLAISQTLTVTGMLQYGMRQTAEVVNQMTSVERILHYTVLEQEGPFDTDPNSKQAEIVKGNWPSSGHVKFNHMYLKYTPDDPPVLKNLDIDVPSSYKIGIVGRTGAGKSSLISALFRLAPLEGNIEVDALDTQTIGLHDLRKKISIIPQEPVLFSATLRYNLDPFEEYEDQALWSALEQVELKEAIPSLEFMVDEGGANFSLGQRQLVCLARAILRNNEILVLDEATANVDPKTDALIQTTIRKKFRKCTVLTIAHRLNTIMDSDRVLVMHAGEMIEYDHPHLLLQKPEGHFTKMVEQTGPAMTRTLREVAENAYNNPNTDYIPLPDAKIDVAVTKTIIDSIKEEDDKNTSSTS